MIIKALSRRSNTGQLVNYIFRYVFREHDKSIKSTKPEQLKIDKGKFIIRHNIRSRSIKGITKEYKLNESFRLVHRKDSTQIFHFILSFSNRDKNHINDSLLKDIASKFIEERGLNNLYAGTKHEDKDHIHLHFLVSGTSLSGYSSRISKQKLHSIKIALDKFQREKYPQLVNSLPEHGKGKRLTKEAVIRTIKAERQTDKQVLLACLEKTYEGSKSQEHFFSRLKELGHEPYFRNGTFQGIRFKGQTKFRLSRLGFDKTRLTALDQAKVVEQKALGELQKLRARDKDLKRAITEPDFKKSTPEALNKNEQKLMDDLSEIRGGREGEEIERNEVDESCNKEAAAEEVNDKEFESNEDKPDGNEEEVASETEEPN